MLKTATHILVVEDEPTIAQVLGEYLEQSGYRVSVLDNGLAVLPFVREHRPDLLVLDLMLPGCDGLTVFKSLRKEFETPVIMATAKVHEQDRLAGLEIGADDYVCKPYSPREVVARVANVLRRSGHENQPSGSPIELDVEGMVVSIYGTPLDLTPSEFRLLAQLTSRTGRVFERIQLLDCLHEDNWDVTDRAVDSHVKNLRRKLQRSLEMARRAGKPVPLDANDKPISPIRSVYGVGYRFEW